VWECEHKESGQVYAVKISRRVPGIDEYLLYEVALMQSLAQFPKYTVKLHQFLEDAKFFYLILEFMGGGDVFGRLLEKGKFSEGDARLIIWKLLKGIECMHQSGIAHRDIKPQNLLLVVRL
jgi:calcium/calmodulin-dependent protein kinase I